MSTRCQTCWNLAQCCTCPIPADECRFHHPRGKDYDACTCGPVVAWKCRICGDLAAVEDDPEFGYACEPCLVKAWAE